MKLFKHSSHIVLLVLLAMLAAACHDDEITNMKFNARIEQVGNGDSKTQLVNEHWIYWVEGDAISINSNTCGSDAPAQGILLNHNSANYPEFNGVFESTLPWDSKYFCALYPYRSGNIITHATGANVNLTTFNDVKIDLPPTQKYATDNSFDHDVMPMVAWYGGTATDAPYTAPNLDFHSLGGIVRVQLYNASDADQNISSITFTSRGSSVKRQLKGRFVVNRYNTFDPCLVEDDNTAENQTVTISTPSGGVNFPIGDLLTFYLVLPATKSIDDSTWYELTMSVNTAGGRSCTKDMNVPIRRNGITYMRALGVTDWWAGSTVTGISGNGTEERPFKIYTVADLKYVRTAFAATNANPSASVKINGQEVTADSWFRIMTSSIELTTSNWTSGAENNTGIQNFRGHMTYYGTNASDPGITNNSTTPIFSSISADGVVEGLSVKCDVNSGSSNSYSPFCLTNRGTIKDCHIKTLGETGLEWGTATPYSGLAGICVNNEEGALIIGCGCNAKLLCSSRRVAGICLVNRGTIRECFAASMMSSNSSPAPVRVAGICDTAAPSSVIEDCYFASRVVNANYPWSGIVSVNRGSVRHCYASENALIITSSSAAGIVGDNMDGTVDYCWSEATLRARYAGMIAATVSGGKLINCFCNNAATMITLLANDGTHYAGGLVGTITGGSVENSFVHMSHINLLDNTGVAAGFVGVFEAGTVRNCYVYETFSPTHSFYGTKGDYANVVNCHVVQGTGEVGGITNWTIAQFTNMQSALNLPANLPAGGKGWEGAVNSTTPPYLEAYELHSSKMKKNRRK